VAAARDLAARLDAIVLLKGPGTVIADPDGRAVVNRTDGPTLAAAGTGDVLTGVISGLVAAGASPLDAAATGAHVHGLAAIEAGTGDELVATDLIGALHPTLESLRSGRDPGRVECRRPRKCAT
jgi:NAD(P)H-hydrate repair Nnr-like enzyme with NAD(P)H-hydrate dehydratase domain